MKIYVYGIIDSKNKIDNPIIGIEGEHVYSISYKEIGLVVSPLKGCIQDLFKEHVLEYADVLEKLMMSFTVLPMRFPTVFHKKEDIFPMVEGYYCDFKENLVRLRDKIEFGIKVIWPGDKIRENIIKTGGSNKGNGFLNKGDSPGKKFIKERFEHYKMDQELEKESDRCIVIVDDYFSRMAVDKRIEKLKTNNLLLTAAYLVRKEKQNDFKDAFAKLQSSSGNFKYLFSGPWPPYNFIQLKNKPSQENFGTSD